MSVSTQEKREQFPARYARKDARTKIYRALYGQPGSNDPQGHPAMNETRKLSELFSFTRACEVFDDNKHTAQFNPQTFAMLLRRLESLRYYKPRG